MNQQQQHGQHHAVQALPRPHQAAWCSLPTSYLITMGCDILIPTTQLHNTANTVMHCRMLAPQHTHSYLAQAQLIFTAQLLEARSDSDPAKEAMQVTKSYMRCTYQPHKPKTGCLPMGSSVTSANSTVKNHVKIETTVGRPPPAQLLLRGYATSSTTEPLSCTGVTYLNNTNCGVWHTSCVPDCTSV